MSKVLNLFKKKGKAKDDDVFGSAVISPDKHNKRKKRDKRRGSSNSISSMSRLEPTTSLTSLASSTDLNQSQGDVSQLLEELHNEEADVVYRDKELENEGTDLEINDAIIKEIPPSETLNELHEECDFMGDVMKEWQRHSGELNKERNTCDKTTEIDSDSNNDEGKEVSENVHDIHLKIIEKDKIEIKNREEIESINEDSDTYKNMNANLEKVEDLNSIQEESNSDLIDTKLVLNSKDHDRNGQPQLENSHEVDSLSESKNEVDSCSLNNFVSNEKEENRTTIETEINNDISIQNFKNNSDITVEVNVDIEDEVLIIENSHEIDKDSSISLLKEQINETNAISNTSESVTENVIENTPTKSRRKSKLSEGDIDEVALEVIEGGINKLLNNELLDDDSRDAKNEDEHEDKSCRTETDLITAKTGISSDSDCDYDSAQEDWSSDTHNKSIDSTDIGEEATEHLGSENSEQSLVEAKNQNVVDGNTMSTEARNEMLIESDEKSCKGIEMSPPQKLNDKQMRNLDRKVSNISTTSDIFNEEMDDLLDEEFDLLDTSDIKGDKSKIFDVSNVELAASSKVNIVIEDSEVSCMDSQKTILNDSLDSVINSSITESGASLSITDTSNNSLMNEASDKAVNSNSSGQENTSNIPEEVSEQVKDSGYYSLPVSPKPAIANVSEGRKFLEEQDSLSEEDEMVTPPSETESISEDQTKCDMLHSTNESLKENSILSDDEVKGSSLHSKNDQAAINNEESLEKTESHKDTVDKAVETKITDNKNISHETGLLDENSQEVHVINQSKPRVRITTSRSEDLESSFSEDTENTGDSFLNAAVAATHKEAEARLAQRRAARAEARELRLRELEKQQHDQENEEEKQYGATTGKIIERRKTRPGSEPRSRGPVAAVAATSNNKTQQYSRRSSEDSTTDESLLPNNVREIKTELKELEEKFRKAMITNAQLDNEKATLTFEVDLIKDRFTDLEESNTQLSKEHRKKSSDFEQLKRVSAKLQEEVKVLRNLLQERDQLIQEYGLVVVGEENGEDESEDSETEDDMNSLAPRKLAVKKCLLSQEASELLAKGAAAGSLDVRLKKYAEEKNDLEDQVRRLKLELEEERSEDRRRRENGIDFEKQKSQEEAERSQEDASRLLNEYKFRVQKAEAEVSTLNANVARLEALVTRYKSQAEELETSEEELKLERRKLQRELRDAKSKLEEMESEQKSLQRQYDKLNSRTGRH